MIYRKSKINSEEPKKNKKMTQKTREIKNRHKQAGPTVNPRK